MAHQMRLCLIRGRSNFPHLCDNINKITKVPGQSLHTYRSSVACYKDRPTVANCFKSNLIGCALDKTCVLPSNVPFKSQTAFYKPGMHEHEKEENIAPNNEEMNLRLSVENDYLSWMRNSYMMTLAGLTILNTSSLTDNMFISEVVFLTAFLNMTAGTTGYLHSLSSLRKRKVMQSGSSFSCQIAAILHLILWVSVLILITSPEEKVEAGDQEKLRD